MFRKLILANFCISINWLALLYISLSTGRLSYVTIIYFAAWLLLICGLVNKSKRFCKLNGIISLLFFVGLGLGFSLPVFNANSIDMSLLLTPLVFSGLISLISSGIAAYLLLVDRDFSSMYSLSYNPQIFHKKLFNFSKVLFGIVVIVASIADILRLV